MAEGNLEWVSDSYDIRPTPPDPIPADTLTSESLWTRFRDQLLLQDRLDLAEVRGQEHA